MQLSSLMGGTMTAAFRLILSVCCFAALGLQVLAQSAPLTWYGTVRDGSKQALIQKKQLLLYFYAPDHARCQQTEALLKQPDVVAAISAKYIPVRINIRESNATAMIYQATDEAALPRLLVIGADDQVVNRFTAAGSNAEFIKQLGGTTAAPATATPSMNSTITHVSGLLPSGELKRDVTPVAQNLREQGTQLLNQATTTAQGAGQTLTNTTQQLQQQATQQLATAKDQAVATTQQVTQQATEHATQFAGQVTNQVHQQVANTQQAASNVATNAMNDAKIKADSLLGNLSPRPSQQATSTAVPNLGGLVLPGVPTINQMAAAPTPPPTPAIPAVPSLPAMPVAAAPVAAAIPAVTTPAANPNPGLVLPAIPAIVAAQNPALTIPSQVPGLSAPATTTVAQPTSNLTTTENKPASQNKLNNVYSAETFANLTGQPAPAATPAVTTASAAIASAAVRLPAASVGPATLNPPRNSTEAQTNMQHLGLDGCCPVQLMESKQWIRGDLKYGAVHRGRTYLFSSETAQQKFLVAPDRYSPVLSGHDPVYLFNQSQYVLGTRQYGGSFNGRLYLFASPESLAEFRSNPAKYENAVYTAENNSGRVTR
jgi:YHS domain-containing protein